MNFIDILIVIPVIWFAFKGFRKGLISELAGLAGLILGIYLAVHFSGFVGAQLRGWLDVNEQYYTLISFSLTFLIVLILVFLLGKFISKIIKAAQLNFVNKIGGLVFGALKVLFILSVLIWLFEKVDNKGVFISKSKRANSALYQPVSKVAPALIPPLKKLIKEIPLPEKEENSDDQEETQE